MNAPALPANVNWRSRPGTPSSPSVTAGPSGVIEVVMGLDALAAGKSCREIDRIARETIDARYPGAFGHSLGHGVGLFIHEQSRLSATSKDVLVAGNVVTVEPGVYIPGLGGCRIEDTVIMTGDGFVNTIAAPKELIEL
jgi:Xaa-Pro aminopeptidase